MRLRDFFFIYWVTLPFSANHRNVKNIAVSTSVLVHEPFSEVGQFVSQ